MAKAKLSTGTNQKAKSIVNIATGDTEDSRSL
jgi:hypothetical protein